MKTVCSLLFALVAYFAPGAFAQTSQQYQPGAIEVETTTGYVPNSATDLFASADNNSMTHLTYLYLASKHTAAVTCRLVDKSTKCGGGACQIWPDVTLAPNTVYTAALGGVLATGGAQWLCSVSSVVFGYARARQ